MNLLWTEGMERSLQVNVGRSGCQVACAAGACRISQVRWSYQVISPLSWSQATKEHFKPRASDPSDTVTIAKIERVSIIYTISSLGLSTSHRDQSSGHAYPMQSMRTVMLELELVVTFAFFVVFPCTLWTILSRADIKLALIPQGLHSRSDKSSVCLQSRP